MADVEAPALLTDARRFDASADEMRASLRRALEQAFGAKPDPMGDDAWTMRLWRGGMRQEVTVRLHDEGPSRSRVDVAIGVERAVSRKLQLGVSTVAMVVAWAVAAANTFSGMRDPIYNDHGRVLPWVLSIVAALALTLVVRHLASNSRVNATSALDPIDALWQALDETSTRERIGKGYRIAPQLAAPDEAEAEAEAEAEVEAAEALRRHQN